MSDVNPPFEAGDIVVRGPFGQRMTIRKANGEFICCVWADEYDRLRESVFRADELERVG